MERCLIPKNNVFPTARMYAVGAEESLIMQLKIVP